MKILIVDNTIDQESWGSKELRTLSHLANGAGIQVEVRRAPHSDLPQSPRGYDRIILSGSKTSALEDAPWIGALHEFVSQTLREQIPYLGVCYGHQTLARVLGGNHSCRKAATPEFGWTEIRVLNSSSLMLGLPEKFYSFSSHFEEVGEAPQSLNVLASSDACAIQAFQLEKRPVFGIQFHPEKDLEAARQVFAHRKKLGTPKTLLHPERSEELYNPKVGETIFRNFLKNI